MKISGGHIRKFYQILFMAKNHIIILLQFVFFIELYLILFFIFFIFFSETGELVKEVEFPDTVTEWVGEAVCVHPELGIGLSNQASIKTFTPFFLDLTYPATARRGEIVPVLVSVFNYLDRSLPVSSICLFIYFIYWIIYISESAVSKVIG